MSYPDISRDASTISPLLADAFAPVADWARANRLNIAPDKSSVTLFTPWTAQVGATPLITVDNSPVPTDKSPKILGVTFDPMLTFTPHVSDIAARASGRLQVLKALAGTSWGQDKETILLTFNAIIKPVLSYAAPVWFPATCRTNVEKLQRVQNQALRIASGSLLKADIQHLHSETSVLPLSDHLSLLCAQFLAGALRPAHPSHALVTQDPGPRNRIPLLQSAFRPAVASFLEDDGTADPSNHRATISGIHTAAVRAHLTSRAPNRVLQRQAPTISSTELALPRHHRTTLSQLRSGQCSRLNSYRRAVGIAESDLCPRCDRGHDTVDHLFDCHEAPTDLSVEDLWRRPVEVARFISALPSFESLPPLDMQEPRPPPEPPPGV